MKTKIACGVPSLRLSVYKYYSYIVALESILLFYSRPSFGLVFSARTAQHYSMTNREYFEGHGSRLIRWKRLSQ